MRTELDYQTFEQPIVINNASLDMKFSRAESMMPTEDKGKGKVFYGQEPPSGESTTTECRFSYQLLAVMSEAAQWGTPSCSQPQPTKDNGVRDSRSN